MSKHLLISAIVAAIVGLAGCKPETITIQQQQRSITINKNPHKIIAMDFGAIDTLDALGEAKMIKGMPLSNTPAYLKQYKQPEMINAGSLKQPDLAAIKAAEPDLIIISPRLSNQYDALSQIAPVFEYKTDNQNWLDSVKQNVTLLGQVTNHQQQAEQQLTALEQKIQTVQKLTKNNEQRAVVVLHNDGKVFTANQSSYAALIHDVLQVKRLLPINENDVNKPSRINVNDEFIEQYQPDIIFVVDRSQAIGKPALKHDYFSTATLAKYGSKVVYLTPDLWYLSGGGLQSINLQIDEVAKALQ